MNVNDAPTCARHPKEVTYIRCASCETPICMKCAVLSPVGYKCRDCGLNKQQISLLAPSPAQTVAAGAISLAAGAVGGAVLGGIGFFGFWLAFIAGRFAGTLILKATSGKSSPLMEIAAGIAIVAGGLAPRVLLAMQGLHGATRWPLGRIITGAGPVLQPVLLAIDLYSLIIVVILAATAISRLRGTWSYRGM